ncbi:MAG: helix-turn-helix domain-containing protein [Saprospiraceae bacterium]
MYDYLPPRFIERVDAIIAANLTDENFSIADLCRQLLMSYSHSYRLIKEKTNLSPSMYLRQKRLEYACQLMEKTELNLTEIAYRSGFATLPYFSQSFSENYGYPPSHYRKQLIYST